MSKRVCIYVRVSTTKQTVENQIQVLREYSDRCGYQITQIYSDNGISGSKGRQDRPGLDQMLKDGVQRKFEMVLVWSVDRLGRSVSHLVEVMNELNELKIDLYFNQQSIDTSTSSGRMIFGISTIADPLAQLKEILISEKGMRIDRDLYPTFRKQIAENKTIQDLIKDHNFKDAEIYLKENILDKPQEFFTLEKLRKSLGVDRNLTVSELLLHALGHIDKIKSKKECLDEEFDKLDRALHPSDAVYNDARQFFEAYTGDDEYREIIDSKEFAKLKVHPSGEAFSKLTPELRQTIPLYIKQNVNLERLSNVR